jgi:hypothetical protein
MATMPDSPDKKEITFFVNNQPVVTSQSDLSGAAIKELAKIPSDYELYEVRGSQTVRVADNQSVHIHENEQFRAIPPGTFGAQCR